MLTWGDDYPIHQTPEPVAFSGTDRNFYDRYFFNGYSRDGDVFIAGALGVYPHLDVMDGAFCVLIDGKQHNVRASRRLHSERMDLQVGPISVRIIEPLKRVGLKVSANDSGITADLEFEGRHHPIEEPRFMRRIGPRMFMDYTRMTQNGGWKGKISVQGREIDVAGWFGTRDRSWGIRPVGAADSQPPPSVSQFFWLWAPFNFAQHAVFFHTNDDAYGRPWNRRAVIERIGEGPNEFEHPAPALAYHQGTRRLVTTTVELGDGAHMTIRPTERTFYMSGLGYTHPVWGHGRDHGELEVAGDVLDCASLDDNAPANMHIQALATATLEKDGVRHEGIGVLEQLLLGPHEPSGFTSMFDGGR